MSIEYFIARRNATSKEGGRRSVMERVATISVALSVAIMIISLAVVYGFKREISSKLTGFTSEAVLSSIASLNNSGGEYIVASPQIEDIAIESSGALHIAPYATRAGIVRSENFVEGVMLKGVDSLYRWRFLSDALLEGELPSVSDSVRSREVLLSESLASRLGAGVGSRLEMLFSDEGGALRRDLFKVSGIYATGLEEWDRLLLFADLRTVQRLNGWPSEWISGYEIHYSSLARARGAVVRLNEALQISDVEGSNKLYAIAADELYPAVFDWLKTHNVNALVVIIIMLIVAGFNMATALLIMVLERTRMIGTLKALGMNNRSLQRLFLYRSVDIIVKGLLYGNIISIGLCLAQQHFKLLTLDASGYMLQYVPIDMSWGWILLLNIAVVASIVALMILPTRMVSRIKIEKSLRFE